ncbi:MAG: 3'-5' exonuclease, partial [Cytophaga sp.]|uniref:3'-5' exonuclease n=1 Tax=Cytophaga sp. TaxID=29535 RepID=UPI003F7EA3B2
SLVTPHRLFISTELDGSLNVWSAIFSNLLYFAYDKTYRFIEVVEEFISYEKIIKSDLKKALELKNKILDLFKSKKLNEDEIVDAFIGIANIIAPKSKNSESIGLLRAVLNSKEQLNSYNLSTIEEITIMTLHKSKGLEFDVVIHLDLYEWILPKKQPGVNNDWKNPVFSNWIQDINLHYVGITRAKKGCLLISSTKRTNDAGQEKEGNNSEFISLHGIQQLRYFPPQK